MGLVVGFSGSPRAHGNTNFLVREVLAAASAEAAETRFFDLNATAVAGCQACMKCKDAGHRGRCAVEDGFAEMNKAIHAADALVCGAPVYIGYWSGQFKLFMDRWYCWRSSEGWHLPAGKRALMICTCGAKAESYQDLLDRQVAWMKDRLSMDARGLMAASLSGPGAAAARPELVEQARAEGRRLAGR
jgi:multimeric flavodoxin WrbA